MITKRKGEISFEVSPFRLSEPVPPALKGRHIPTWGAALWEKREERLYRRSALRLYEEREKKERGAMNRVSTEWTIRLPTETFPGPKWCLPPKNGQSALEYGVSPVPHEQSHKGRG